MTVDLDSNPANVNVYNVAMDTLAATSLETVYSDLWYEINACLCEAPTQWTDENPSCLPETASVNQNQEFSICLKPNKNDVKIKNVKSLHLEQGGVLKSSPVEGGNSDALTTVDVGGIYIYNDDDDVEDYIYDDSLSEERGNWYMITTWAISAFFLDGAAADMTAYGEVELEFTKSRVSRRLRVLSEQSGSFDVTVHLSDDDSLVEGGGVGLMCSYALIVPLLVSRLWFI